MCRSQTVRHLTVQFIRLFKRFSPLQPQPVRQYKRAQIWYNKTEYDRGKIVVFEAVSERECLFHESERKEKAGEGYFKNVST